VEKLVDTTLPDCRALSYIGRHNESMITYIILVYTSQRRFFHVMIQKSLSDNTERLLAAQNANLASPMDSGLFDREFEFKVASVE
jgi:hypothetical protein